MFFEGPEKKLEISISKSTKSLREQPFEVWSRVVKRAGASILSSVSNSFCTAYLLSESSLFVFDQRLILITCGRTNLVDALFEILRFVPTSDIQTLIYERKNHHFPEYQNSNFFDDLQRLEQVVPGVAYRFGDEDEHHVYLFHLDRNFSPANQDMTLEILMHGIDESAKEIFCDGSQRTLQSIHERTGILSIFDSSVSSETLVDEHIFKPVGYSLNAISDSHYYTVHVTPEEMGSYASFESNFPFPHFLSLTTPEAIQQITKRTLEIFQPKSCDILFFEPTGEKIVSPLCFGSDYRVRRSISQKLSCGFRVHFFHCFLEQDGIEEAVPVRLPRLLGESYELRG